MELLGNTFHQYFTQYKDECPCPDKITMAMPISIRDPVSRVEDIRLNNEFIPFVFKYSLNRELNLESAKTQISGVQNTLYPFGFRGLIKMTNMMPFNMSSAMNDEAS